MVMLHTNHMQTSSHTLSLNWPVKMKCVHYITENVENSAPTKNDITWFLCLNA